jgi:hypothetical protein
MSIREGSYKRLETISGHVQMKDAYRKVPGHCTSTNGHTPRDSRRVISAAMVVLVYGRPELRDREKRGYAGLDLCLLGQKRFEFSWSRLFDPGS